MQTPSPERIFLAQSLTYAGTLPLIAAVFAAYLNLEGVDALNMARFYAAVIVAFLGGLHWAHYLFQGSKCPRNLLATSSATACLAWSSLMLPAVKLALALQSLCFIYLLVLDYRLKEAKSLPPWFYALRSNATAIVVVCLMMLELS